MNQVELLLRLSQNAEVQGADLGKRHNAEREAFLNELLNLEKMAKQTLQNIHDELGRWGITPDAPQPKELPKSNGAAPREKDPIPSFLQKGPQP